MLTVCACVCVCFLPDSQGSAELNPLKCPPGFCPHVSAEFPRIHPTIQTLCVRALWNALGLTGAWTVCVCVHVCKWAYNIKKGKFFFLSPFLSSTSFCEGDSETHNHLTFCTHARPRTQHFSSFYTHTQHPHTLRVTCALTQRELCTHSPWHPHTTHTLTCTAK